MRMIDIHRHLWDTDWFPPDHRMGFAIRAAKRTPVERDPLTILPRVGQGVYDPDGTMTIEDMDDLGIDVSVIMTMDWGMAYVTRGLADSPLPIREINRQILSLREKYPGRVYAFAGVDQRRTEALELFELAVKEWGAIGYKPYTPNGYYANDARLIPIYQRACELNVPVLVHCGGSPGGWAAPEPLEEIAVQFPDLKVIMGHANLQSRFETGYYWQAIKIASSVPNIYLDITDWQVLGAIDERNLPDFWHVLDVMRNSVGAHRILWGTDLPMQGRQYDLTRRWVDMFKNLPDEAAKYGVSFTQDEAELICYKNAERILGIPSPVEA